MASIRLQTITSIQVFRILVAARKEERKMDWLSSLRNL